MRNAAQDKVLMVRSGVFGASRTMKLESFMNAVK